MAGYPKYFPPIMLAMVRTGEDSGTLDTALLRVAEYRQRQEEILARVRTAMAYPVLMALVGAGTIIFMFTFVIPKLSGLFNNLGSKLPLPTQILMSISHAMQNRVAWIIVGALVAGIALYLRARPNDARRLWSRFSLKAPALGDFVLKADMARFARTLELLLKAGIPILRAIEITTPVLSNDILRSEMKKMHEGITAGGTFGQSLAKSREYPLFMTNLVTVGEESGKLDEAMDEIARFYERETDEAIKVLTSLMEPIMILVMGAIVGFIVIAMMLPMFELSLAIK
jgi:type II secretory pathway component PulF